MDCEEQIYSNEYYDFLVRLDGLTGEELPDGLCTQEISPLYRVYHIRREGTPALNITDYTYSAIPKCLLPLDRSALEASGILKIQNQPTLSLSGQGILIGFVDTGIAYTNPVFQTSDGRTRIEAIWDQNIPGSPPEGFLFGTEYNMEQINEALRQEDPYAVVPSRDEDGHGTFLAGIAAGSVDYENDFIGAAPQAAIAVVKLKPAKEYLKEYYFIPRDRTVYAENDLMLGIAYLDRLAKRLKMPLVICIALGTNMGNHGINGYLTDYINTIGIQPARVVTVAVGNEANARHHYLGRLDEETLMDSVEVNVEEGVEGVTAEIWVRAPELYTIGIVSPTGEAIPRLNATQSFEYRFIFENTVVRIDYRVVGPSSGDQIIMVRFTRPTRGIWTIQVYGTNYLGGDYHIWLPMRGMLSGEVYFIRSNSNTTFTVPSNALVPISVGGYDARDGSLYIDSGRGFTVDDRVKPELSAPGVNVYGPDTRGGFQTKSGTSISAAITAGASALYLEWAVSRQGYNSINSIQVKNFLIRGAIRDAGRIYPSKEWGADDIIVSS